MSIFDHIFLFLFLFLFLHAWGKVGSRISNSLNYWLYATLPIISYSFILGSRFGWGPDYLSYKYRMEHAFTYFEEQLGFRWLNQLISLMGFNYVGGYIVYSFIFIVSAFVLIRSFKKEATYMYSFVVPATLTFVNSAIRQGIALSFVMLAIYFFYKKKWFLFILSIIIGASIHTSILVTVAVLVFVFLFFKKLIHWKVSIPIYLFCTFFFDKTIISIFANYLQKYISLDNKFQSYIDNADIWFGKDGINSIYEQSSFALILSSLFYLSIILLGYYALKIKPSNKVLFLYNSIVISIIIYRLVFLFEILRRLAEPILMLYFIVIGYSIYVFSLINKSENNRKFVNNLNYIKTYNLLYVYKLCVFFILSYLLLFWGRFIFFNPDAIFYWNK